MGKPKPQHSFRLLPDEVLRRGKFFKNKGEITKLVSVCKIKFSLSHLTRFQFVGTNGRALSQATQVTQSAGVKEMECVPPLVPPDFLVPLLFVVVGGLFPLLGPAPSCWVAAFQLDQSKSGSRMSPVLAKGKRPLF